jgi:cardiolipin synthase
MIHAKVLIVDDTWCVLGSTNFDNRSFGINDEVNVAIMHTELGHRLRQDFLEDLALSQRITLEEWERRPMKERVLALLGSVLERQE